MMIPNKIWHTTLLIICSLQLLSQNADSIALRKHFNYFLTKSNCYKNLEFLSTKIESRLSGSPGAAKAVVWAKKAMYEAGADTVYLQPCMVPHWVRGEKEMCSSVNSKTKLKINYSICALGNSIATPNNGISAPVIIVNSYSQLDSLGEKNIKGKIVFYNVYFDHTHLSTGTCYGETVTYRYSGPSKAAKYGAVATIVRSMSSINNNFPHTGVMGYDTTLTKTKIPACAISFSGADELLVQLNSNPNQTIYLKMSCQMLDKELSYNVVGEIKGSEKPQEIIMAGGHLDAWDNGQGAHDDGAGVVQAIEVLAMYKKQNIKPKHTIRAVAFMNEENGGAGGKAYFEDTKKNNLKHIAALESDAGGFSPRGIAVDTTNGAYKNVLSWKSLLDPYFLQFIKKGGHGADIQYLKEIGVPLIGFEPDGQKYFDYHHTADDTFDKVNKRELELSAGVIGSVIYLIDTKGW
jgi:carboxypeptidase Q